MMAALCLIKWTSLYKFRTKFSCILWGLCFSWAHGTPLGWGSSWSTGLICRAGTRCAALIWQDWHDTPEQSRVPAVFHMSKGRCVSQLPPGCFPWGHFIKHLLKSLEEWSLKEIQGTAWKSQSQTEILVLLYELPKVFTYICFMFYDQAVVAIPKQGQGAAEAWCV